jgi:hypothetical protein
MPVFSPGVSAINAAAAEPPTISYTDQDVSSAFSGSSPFTFSSQAIGTAAANRHVIAVLLSRWFGPTSISACTIGGVSATIAVTAKTSDRPIAGIAIASVTSGTTADVVWTVGGGGTINLSSSTYAVYGLSSITAKATNTATAVDPLEMDTNVTTEDIVVFGGVYDANSAGTVTGGTEDFDVQFDNGGRVIGAHYTATSDESPRSFDINFSTSAGAVGVLGVWR